MSRHRRAKENRVFKTIIGFTPVIVILVALGIVVGLIHSAVTNNALQKQAMLEQLENQAIALQNLQSANTVLQAELNAVKNEVTKLQSSVTPIVIEWNEAKADNTVPEANVSRGATRSEREYLAGLISAEANGQPYEGKVAVGQTVMDRLNHPTYNWGKSIASVIDRPRQFATPRGSASEECYAAADEALAGRRIFEDRVIYFCNPATSDPIALQWMRKHKLLGTIGNHEFYSDELVE